MPREGSISPRRSPGRPTGTNRAVAPGPARSAVIRWPRRRFPRRRPRSSEAGEPYPMDRPEILMTPGPTPVPPEVLLAQGGPFPYHRGPGYTKLLTDITEALKRLMKTQNDVVLFAASGTGGLESVVANLCSPGDRG